MFNFTPEEWYWLCGVAVIVATAHHQFSRYVECVRKERAIRRAEMELNTLRAKKSTIEKRRLATEVVRTRLMVDAWLLRNPHADLRGGKGVLAEHVNALRAYHKHMGTFSYKYPGETTLHYDSPYWRAIWHVYHHGRVRCLPPCPLEA